MPFSVLQRIPVVAGVAYIDRVRRLPPSFPVTLAPESDNRYFRHAIAVMAPAGKVGYVAPEISRRYFEGVKSAASPVDCPARRAAATDHETSGVELLLDFSNLQIAPAE
jgi:hypothetical protein